MKAAIFDMDGLMFDTERIYLEAWDYVGHKTGINNLKELGLKTLGLNKDMTTKLLQEEVGPKYSVTDLFAISREFVVDYFEHNHVPVKKGLYNLLTYLKSNKYKIAVASSTARKTVTEQLKDANVFEFFDCIICGDMIQRSKPEPDIYLKACDELQISPSECYALEDSRNGLLSAKAAGCKVIMIPDLWQPDEEIKSILTAKFNDLDEVIEYLKKQK